MSDQSLNWTIAALAYDLPDHDFEDVVDWKGHTDQAPEYTTRVKDIVAVAELLDPMLCKLGSRGSDEIDPYITIGNVAQAMVVKYKATRSYRLSASEIEACLDWQERYPPMDPNAVLKDLREVTSKIISGELKTPGSVMYSGEELAEKFHNLDQWIRSGGFLPSDWAGKDVSGTTPVRPVELFQIEERHPTHLDISPTMFCVSLAEKLGQKRYTELEGIYATSAYLLGSWLWWYEQAAIAVDQHERSYELIGDAPDRFWDYYVLEVVAAHLQKEPQLPRNVAELLDVAVARALKDKDDEADL